MTSSREKAAEAASEVKRPTARERKVEERRERIAQLASQGILRIGYEGLSVNVLAEEAGLSVGGLYRYISQKSDLLVMACEDIYGGLLERIHEAASANGPAEARLRGALAVYFDACVVSRDQILLMYREYRHLPPDAQSRFREKETSISRAFKDIVDGGVAEGVFDCPSSDVLALDIIVTGHLPALKGWAVKHLPGSDLTENQVDFIMRSLRV